MGLVWANGSLERLVAREYICTYGIGYQDTFDLVDKMNIVSSIVFSNKLWREVVSIWCKIRKSNIGFEFKK